VPRASALSYAGWPLLLTYGALTIGYCKQSPRWVDHPPAGHRASTPIVANSGARIRKVPAVTVQLKVLVVDDHAAVRAGLRHIILTDLAQPAVVGEAANGLQALDLARSEAWDAILLDITMPGLSGLQVLRQLRAEHNGTAIIMVSTHTGNHYVRACLAAGATGYLSKEDAPLELVPALQAALVGEVYLGHAIIAGQGDSAP
jgi:CheY-like chemotaxis protein